MAIDEQEDVARVLRARPRTSVPPGFAERVAARIDTTHDEFLDSVNWRAWTWGLAPAAAALLLAAWLGIGGTGASPTPASGEGNTGLTGSVTLLQPTTSGDALLEAVLTGAAGDPVEESGDVR